MVTKYGGGYSQMVARMIERKRVVIKMCSKIISNKVFLLVIFNT